MWVLHWLKQTLLDREILRFNLYRPSSVLNVAQMNFILQIVDICGSTTNLDKTADRWVALMRYVVVLEPEPRLQRGHPRAAGVTGRR